MFLRAARILLLATVLCWSSVSAEVEVETDEGVYALESTSITLTRSQVAQLAALWETDTLAISPFATAQYPTYTGTWQYIFPTNSIQADGDVHTAMAVDSSGTGSNGNNAGNSPIICELINATSAQLSHLNSLRQAQAIFRGIFRFYTEHLGERGFELHPVTSLDMWNGAAFTADTDYRGNIVADADGTKHTSTTLANAVNGSQTVTATVQSDNTTVTFSFPSPSVNYVQYDGVALSGVTSDAVSSYFFFRPNLVPSATLRCRLVANTTAARAATGISANQSLTVNALTRTDMSFVASQIANLDAGQSATFPRQVELIVLGLPGLNPPLQLTNATSNKTHGGAGAFSINLPLNGTPAIECRSGGPTGAHTLVFTFSNPVVSGNATVASGAASISGAAAISGNTMTVNLTGVANAQTVTVALSNVTDTYSQVLPGTSVMASFLLGDINGDGSVNSGDAVQARDRSGQAVDPITFRTDLNVDGTLNSADATVVRSASGTGLPQGAASSRQRER